VPGSAIGPHEILSALGRAAGGRSIARDTTLNREVALKVLANATFDAPNRWRTGEPRKDSENAAMAR
jgi:hypothetical protein